MPAPFVKVHRAPRLGTPFPAPSGDPVDEMRIEQAWRLTAIERLSAHRRRNQWDGVAHRLSQWMGYLSLTAGGAAAAWALGLAT